MRVFSTTALPTATTFHAPTAVLSQRGELGPSKLHQLDAALTVALGLA